MSNQWFPSSAGPQQWNTQTPGSYGQQNQNPGGGQWQPMQQPSVPPHQQTPYQQSFQAPQFVTSQPSGSQLPGQQVVSGQLQQGQGHGRGFQGHPQQQPQFQQPQQPMSQHAYILEQQRLAREEQRVREIEIQKRKLRTMNISGGAAATNSSIDSLIGLTNLAELSPASQKKAAAPPKAVPSTSQIASPKQTPPLNKPRAWTVDSSNFLGVFAQHDPPVQHQDDSFGDFQSGEGMAAGSQVPHPQPFGAGTNAGYNLGQFPGSKVTPNSLQQPYPQYVSGIGVNPTSSYTHPIPATSVSQVTTQGGVSGGEQRARALSSPYVPNNGPPGQAGSTHSTRVPPVEGHPAPGNGLHKAPKQLATGRSGGLDSSSFPPVYLEVYTRCLDKDGTSLSTELLFPVLMSSQLPKSFLGGLWQAANRGTPGKLNQTELFVLLGFIGLAQAGNPSPKFEDLQKAPAPPIPVLGALANHSSPAAPEAKPVTVQHLKGSTSTTTPTKSLTDDFGIFQRGQLPPASLSSLPTPVQNPSSLISTSILSFDTSKSNPTSTSISTLPASKSTSTPISTFVASIPNTGIAPAVSVAMTRPLLPQPDQLPLNINPNDKYGVFNELRTNTDTTAATSFANFESFVSVPTQTQPSKGPSADITSTTAPPVSFSSSSSSNQGWADFSAVLVPTSTVPVSSLPITPTPLKGDEASGVSAFDSLLPSELKPKTVPSDQPSKQLASLEIENKDTLKVIDIGSHKDGTLSGGLLSLDMFAKTPQPKKQLTGLDILNEEMTARLLSSESNQQPAPSLDDKPLVPESMDEFGDFETYSSRSPAKGGKVNHSVNSDEDLSALETKPPTVNSDPCKVWQTCLMKCSEVLETCTSVFGAVEEKTLLEEIAQSEEGRNKLRGIAEVYRVASRVYFSLRKKDQAVESAEYTKNIQRHWSSLVTTLPNDIMKQLFSESSMATVEDNDVLSDTISKCSLCLVGKSVSISSAFSLDRKHDKYYLPLLFHQGQSYHVGCANFWSNVVQEELPALN